MWKQIAQPRSFARRDELVCTASNSEFGAGPSVWTDHVADRHFGRWTGGGAAARCWCCRRCWVSLTQAKVQGLSQGRLTSRGLGPLGGTSEVQSKRGNATVFESSKANAVGTPLAKPTQREELRWKNKQRTYGKPSTKTSLGGDGSTCLGGCQPATPTYVGSPPDDEQTESTTTAPPRK